MVNKYLKFNIVDQTDAASLLTEGVQLVNSDDIQSVVYAAGVLTLTLKGLSGVPGAGGGQAGYTVPAFVAGAADISGTQAQYDVPLVAANTVGSAQGRIITLVVSTSRTGAQVVPTITNGASAPDKAIFAAMTANPGGVQSTVQLGVDQAATPLQMWFKSFTASTAVIA